MNLRHPVQRFRPFAMAAAFLILVIAVTISKSGRAEEDANYDRLDGTGTSGKKVHVVEWEGNLEIHVYPAGSLKGLALKLDKRNKDSPVMVIGYRFDNDPSKQLIRRAILGIGLKEGFKTYRDPSADEYDKIIISNNTLSNQVIAFRLDPEPSQLYPDGHPALANAEKNGANAASTPSKKPSTRLPAAQGDTDPPSEDGAIPWKW